MANGMAGLFVGSSGLKTAQTALNTTAHNLSNINTTGYTRQQVTFSDTTYVNVSSKDKVSYASYGLGVAISEVRRIRDQYIDLAYRNENSRLGFYESQYNAVQEIEDQFGEMQGVTYESYLTNLYDSINELAKNPTSTVARSSLIQNATAFIEKSENVYKGLRDYQTTLNTQVSNMVNKINDLAGQIYKLNKSIAKVEAPGMEKANDLRDQRDAAIDELSKYIDITYYESENKETIINAAGVPLVTAGELTAMSTRVVEGTTLVIPTWPSYERDVYEDGKLASNADDTDKGQLKGLIIARGNMVVDYTVVPIAPDSNDYDMSTEEGRTAYQQAYNEYAKQQEYYNTYVEPSAILSAMAGFDKLVNGIVERINGILCPEKLRQGLILILMQMEVRFRQIHTYIIQLISRFFMTDTEERLPELITVMVLTAMHLVRNYTRVQAEQRFRLIHMSILCLTWTRLDTVWMTIRLLVQNCFQELEQTDILRLQVIMERQSILETILTRQIMNHYISLAI